jgi:phospholipid N-methyltransferase
MRKRGSSKKQVIPKRRRSALPRKRKAQAKAKIVIDPLTGFPVLTLGPGAPVLTHKEVQEILSDFP